MGVGVTCQSTEGGGGGGRGNFNLISEFPSFLLSNVDAVDRQLRYVCYPKVCLPYR